MGFLLLRSGDVETNPGPLKTHGAAVSEAAAQSEVFTTDNTAEASANAGNSSKYHEIIRLLKDLQARSLDQSARHEELAQSVGDIKTGQNDIRLKLEDINEGLSNFEKNRL